MAYLFEKNKLNLTRVLDRRVRLSNKDKENIIVMSSNWLSQSEIATEYWVHRTTIWYILNISIYDNKKTLQKDYKYDYWKEYRVNQVKKNREYKKNLIKEWKLNNNKLWTK